MRATIILEWIEDGRQYRKKIRRGKFLSYLINIIENYKVLEEVRSLSKDADSICVNVDEDAIKQEKNLIFKYDENFDFYEDSKTIKISKDERIYYFIKSYCQEVVVFKVIENNQVRIRSKSKQQVISIMQAIKKGYPDNNEISTKLSEILPSTYVMVVNKDRNNSCPERPMIICYTVNKEEYNVLTIMNHHKIIWAHLNEWCQ